VGALPGRIIQGISQAATSNPVFMLDEIDKLGADYRGDPSSALLEVLDPEQNSTFRDHYLGVPYDLSRVLFVATANVLDPIQPAFLDRMEVISLSGYTEGEKLQIARQHLIPKQLDENGVTAASIEYTTAGLRHIVEGYTREAGLRNFEREIGSVARKVAVAVARGKKRKVRITPAAVARMLGPTKFFSEERLKKDEIGVATGLAWTPVGGDVLFVEANTVKGKGAILLTGMLGAVMKESAQAALTYAKAHADVLSIPGDYFENHDLHVHVPEGAIPKDGPSAGITMAVSLFSAVTRIPVLKDVAMTGEITLRGKVLPVGGIKDKLLAAFRAGIRTIILSAENDKDLDDLPEEIRSQMEFHLVSNMDEVIKVALEGGPAGAPALAPDVRPVEGGTVAH
jgi:ATP-dependent Lon protease